MPEMCGARENGGRSEVEVVLCRDTEPELGYNESGSKGHHSPGAAASPGCSLYKNNLISLSHTIQELFLPQLSLLLYLHPTCCPGLVFWA